MENIQDKLITYLKQGLTQQEIAQILQIQEIKPNSVSSVEKKLKKIREEYGAKTLFHLGFIIASENKNH